MVSKVAVIAIVGIVAIPILLGYALNLNDVTETDYKTAGDSVNVTPLLQNGTDYTYANADIYQLNTRLNSGSIPVIPDYNNITATKTAYPLTKTDFNDQAFTNYTYTVNGSFYIYLDNGNTSIDFYGKVNGGAEQLIMTRTSVYSVYYDAANKHYSYTSYGSQNSQSGDGELTRLVLNTLSSYTVGGYIAEQSNNGQYVDFSAGFTIDTRPAYNVPNDYQYASIVFPGASRTALITMDLSSITEDNYAFQCGYFYLEKTTTDGVVKWQVKQSSIISSQTIDPVDLYYDQNSSNNTYQLKIWGENNPDTPIRPNYKFIQHLEFRYVGAWPSLIGEANYYQTFDVQYQISNIQHNSFYIAGGFSEHSPTLRIDAAEYQAMEYQLISDQQYVPADFKTNPSTTIDNVQIYGLSLTFGGNTYTVSKGNITLGTHQIPVKGLVLSSVPNGNGEYDNKIGDTVISTTAAPSAITFNGKWSASISTVAQEQYQYTKTEWIAGGFAWNGMDDNFLMVGLITSLGAFIALGIYARRSRASVWPLMLVCGGAAALFFIML